MDKINAPRLHLAYLDGIRACAALYVILYHIYTACTSSNPEWLNRLMTWMGYGHFSVDVFIVVSGYCLILPVMRTNFIMNGGYSEFIYRRARRILPAYYAAVAIGIISNLLVSKIFSTHIYLTSFGVFSFIFLLQDLFSSASWQINGALWSVAVECRIYLVFPLIVAGLRRWGGIRMTIALLVISLILSIILAGLFRIAPFFNTNEYTIVGPMPHYLGLFGIGTLAALLGHDVRLQSLRTRLPALPLCGFSILVAFISSRTTIRHGLPMPILVVDNCVGFATFFLLVYLADGRQNLLKGILESKALVKIGTFSYSLYLIHTPVMALLFPALLRLHLEPTAFFFVVLAVTLVLVLGLGYLFFLAFERPFLRRRQKI